MEFKQVYFTNGQPYLAFKGDDGEYQYPKDEWTDVPPPGGLYQPIYFDGNEWHGASKEEWEKNLPKEEIVINEKDEIIMDLTTQLAETNTKVENIQQAFVDLTKQVAFIQGGK